MNIYKEQLQFFSLALYFIHGISHHFIHTENILQIFLLLFFPKYVSQPNAGFFQSVCPLIYEALVGQFGDAVRQQKNHMLK